MIFYVLVMAAFGAETNFLVAIPLQNRRVFTV
jgi:hypothetical protein